ncbi:hypothetical protein [Campylobacter sp. CCUG 57310]|uniref:hypothetical protein n=1 Tax=Campylobacter sp. CCUG 57310 TaxID=2517362 RepID=UPI001C204253|nr:hypothetical protein [Campylobacter sp. CCUG 57310]
MAKSLVRNQIAGRTFGFAVPADGATAKTFCDNHLEGIYNIYEVESTSGNEVEASVLRVTVTGKNEIDWDAYPILHNIIYNYILRLT